MKKIMMSVFMAFIMPIVLNAGGIGVYVPYTLSIEKDASKGGYLTGPNHDRKYRLEKKGGIGIAITTNLTEDKDFGYKFSLEYTHPQSEDFYASSTKREMLHTFEFAIVRTQVVRLWVGPRINIGYETYENNLYEYDGVEFGIAPTVGINISLAKRFALAFDVDYKFSTQVGSYDNPLDDGTYRENIAGSTARLSIFYRFNE